MKYVLVAYNNDLEWVKEYTDDWLMFDRSDNPADFPNTTRTKNTGQVDYDKLGYLIDNYDNLPDVFLWGKANLFKSITKEEFDLVKDNKVFTPLLTKNHRTYGDNWGAVNFYTEDGLYNERNDSWYFNVLDHKIGNYTEFAEMFKLPNPPYLKFAPGGNYILTREVVHKYPKSLYKKMKDLLPYSTNPAEAHCLERSYYTLWK